MIVAALAGLMLGLVLGLVAARVAALEYRRRWREALALVERMEDRRTNPLPFIPGPKLKPGELARLRREIRRHYR